jgi:hypothetical protein
MWPCKGKQPVKLITYIPQASLKYRAIQKELNTFICLLRGAGLAQAV